MFYGLLLAVAIAAGSFTDRPSQPHLVFTDKYQVLAVDFHTHTSFGSDGLLSPLGLILQAERQGLDGIALTAHNETATARLGQWFAGKLGNVVVLEGEEIVAPRYHLIAVGIHKTVGFRQDAADAIDEIHRQGGVAIAAHPSRDYSKGFSNAAVAKLDGAEICHPMVYEREQAQRELEEFAKRGVMAPIGSSDYHGVGQLGSCRTFVFARENTERAIVEAVRDHRTVVFGPRGAVYGPPELVATAEAAGLRQSRESTHASALDWLSRIAGLIGLIGLVTAPRTQAQRVCFPVRGPSRYSE